MFKLFLNPNNMKNKIVMTTLIVISSIIVGYICLLSDYPMFRNDEFINLKKLLDSSNDDELSSFVDLYNRINKSNGNKYCPCDVITSNVDPFRHVISPKTKIYSLKIKKDFGHDNCLKYELLNSDYLHGQIGIKSASQYYFHKTIEKLNDREKITLLVILENPALYNLERRKEKVENKIIIYQNILAQENGR
jgi:hypothetical protein